MRKLLISTFAVLFTMPIIAAENPRVGIVRNPVAASRAPTSVNNLNTAKPKPVAESTATAAAVAKPVEEPADKGNCRDAYRNCMDQFCLLDESEGARCACSESIHAAKTRMNEINDIQALAESLYTEGVEREQRGAKAALVFSDGEKTTGARLTTTNVRSLLEDDEDDFGELAADDTLGGALYAMASKNCAVQLNACGTEKEMEEILYSRQITADCKSFSGLLDEQKKAAEQNKATAEKAVRTARLEMLDETNLYNRGECLLAYKACISDKGGCGANFENCLDSALLQRRANACENVLEQCMAVRTDVIADWAAESVVVLKDAEKYADKFKRENCLARVQMCLEDGCSKDTNGACLSNITVATGICPVIDECDEIAPGTKNYISGTLGQLAYKFCQNDFTSCLAEKCGANYDRPECIGRTTSEIIAMCPQKLFPMCNNANVKSDFGTITASALLGMDYQMVETCKNYVAERLAATNCGADMSCLPDNTTVAALSSVPTDAELAVLRAEIRESAATEVKNFFDRLMAEDGTIKACAEARKPEAKKGQRRTNSGKNLTDAVFGSARLIAEMGYTTRELRNLDAKVVELNRGASLAEKKKNCETGIYAPQEALARCSGSSAQRDFRGRQSDNSTCQNYSYIVSSQFEESLSNCHVCRKQQICETGGESGVNSMLKAGGGGLAGGAGLGSAAGGWGALIGGVVGLAAGAVGGGLSGNMTDVCHEIEACEDINM